MCAELKDIPYGKVQCTDKTPGSQATYTCDDGYTLEGKSKRTCLSNGNWRGKEPTCKQVN